METHAQVVVIGGGVVGCSVLYHLAKFGWTDAILLERDELTSGSTWHAAGLVPNFIGSLNMAKVHQHAIDLYNTLEMETGLSAGFHRCGALRLGAPRRTVSDLDAPDSRQCVARTDRERGSQVDAAV